MALAALLLSGCASSVKDTRKSFTTVVLDAGHGAHDPGARSRSGLQEKTVALDLTLRLDRKLREAGFKTVLTRKDDTFIPLGGRVKIGNRQSNAIFVSLHFNYAKHSRARGVEVFYHHPYGRDIAVKIQNSMLQTGAMNRGVKHANFHVLRHADFPAVLIEGGFLTNRAEERLIRSPQYRERLAEQIAWGIIEQRYGTKRLPRKVESLRVANSRSERDG